MSTYNVNSLLSIAIVVCVLVLSDESRVVKCDPVISVDVVNELPNNESLTIHCKEEGREDDLGIQTLGVGQKFSWSFRVNRFWEVQYRCYMHWSKGQEVAARDGGGDAAGAARKTVGFGDMTGRWWRCGRIKD
ncbi:S-protein homolog 24 [Spinacia oleracea]|uniref:S-protein homolog n=1 Tax=Spinacia oleracea TaxID=3562 RepID=A0ABM3REH6_SPIOL|nr:S-protein homolog 24-like [Spinacia oleracea]